MIDTAKLMILVDVAHTLGGNTEEKYLHYYAFFAKQADIQFTYTFQVLDSLYSPTIHEDLSTLENAAYIEIGSGYHVTEKGYEWITEFPKEETTLIQTKLNQYLKEFVKQDEIVLFKNAYNIITRRM